MAEMLTAAAVGASFVYISGKLRTKLLDMASGRKKDLSADERGK